MSKMNNTKVHCPICNSVFDEFLPYGAASRPNALCPKCGGVERHRLLWLYLKARTNFFSDNIKMLDIAPTEGLSDIMKGMPNIEYMSIDKYSNIAMRKMDLTLLEFPDNNFDCIICYHVLEHIPDDKKAMEELFRVLKPGGWAILQVPLDMTLEKTIEGTHIESPEKRKELFGQEDHVRQYGRDYKDRLEDVGFNINIDHFGKTLSSEIVKKYVLLPKEEIYFCTKQIENTEKVIQNENVILKKDFICHLVYEHDFIQQYNDMIARECDWQEHVFVVYANHAWDPSKKYNLKNSYYIDSFDDALLKEYVDKASQIIVHCLYTPELTDFLYKNQHLLNKVNWKLWGGDLYLYKMAGTPNNTAENEAKRKVIIKNLAYITSPIKDEYNHAIEVYGGNAKYLFASYMHPKDFSDYPIDNNTEKTDTVNILVGNSGYETSSHLEAFSYLQKFSNEKIKIYCPLSYGDKEYIKGICAEGKKLFGEKFIPLLDFMKFDDYSKLLSTIDIGVMNHNRQQGVGNIVALLYFGKKVYMRPDISTFKTMKRLGISVYDINKIVKEDFKTFVESDDDTARNNSELVDSKFSNRNTVLSWKKIFKQAIDEKKSYKRVLYINHNLYPIEISGTPISTYNHAVGMNKKGKDVAVLIPSPEVTEGFDKQNEKDFVLYKLPRLDKYDAFLENVDDNRLDEYLQSFENVIDDFQPDLVQLNDYVFMPEKLISILYNRGIFVVRNVCNMEEICHMDYPVISNGAEGKLCSGPETPEKCAKCYLVNRMGKNADEIIEQEATQLSESIKKRFDSIQAVYENNVDGIIFTENSFKEYFKKFINIREEITTIIPRGIKFDFEKAYKTELVNANKVHFAYVGHLMFSKGIDIVLSAFELLKEMDNFQLDIYGAVIDNCYMDWVKRLEKEYPSKIKYHGVFQKNEIEGIADSIDVAIVPSHFDTYNRVVREFLYLGVPIISTNFFGSSVIKDGVNGIKINIGDYEGLSAAMRKMIENPDSLNDLFEGAKKTKIPLLEDEIEGMSEFYDQLVTDDSERARSLKQRKIDAGRSTLRTIAFYLPQFHPVPENDKAWGKGFTEWTNVAKAQPLFKSHYQPHVPSDLGFYDLRLDEVRKEQIELAKQYGISGFCYYYYWFNGKQVLESPINSLLANKELDFPFCACWANENWTRKWDGHNDDVIFGQEHNAEDDIDFIKSMIKYFKDDRYITINGKPLLLIYRTELFPNIKETAERWREEVRKAGINDLYLVRVEGFEKQIDPEEIGFDAAVEFAPDWSVMGDRVTPEGASSNKLNDTNFYDYRTLMQNMISREPESYKLFRGVTPSWDNTARRGDKATVFLNSSPELYEYWLSRMVDQTRKTFRDDEQIVFINAWNEWGEGNHLEPDQKYGHAYLQATANALNSKLIDKENVFDEEKEELKKTKILVENLICMGSYFKAYFILQSLIRDDLNLDWIEKNMGELYEKVESKRTKDEWNEAKCQELLSQAEEAISAQQVDSAKSKVLEILDYDPENIEALNGLSVVHILEGENEYALDIIDLILAIEPDNETAKSNLEYCAVDSDSPEDILEDNSFRNIESSDSQNQETQSGVYEDKEKEIEQLKADLLKVSTHLSEYRKAKLLEANELIEQKNNEKGIEVLSNLLELFNKDLIVLSMLGQVYFSMGSNEEARKYFELVLLQEPSNKLAIEKLTSIGGSIYQKDPETGISIDESKLRLAEQYLGEGKVEESEKILLELYNISPNNLEVLNDLAAVRIFQNNLTEALQILQHILDADPSNEVAIENYEYIKTLPEFSELESEAGNELSLELPPIVLYRVSSHDDFAKYDNEMRNEYRERSKYESDLVTDEKEFVVHGTCIVCKEDVDFKVDFNYATQTSQGKVPNWRERLVCPKCDLNNRMRLSLHLVEELLPDLSSSKVYIAEQTTPMYRKLKEEAGELIGSEFIGEKLPFGQKNEQGIRNEDFTNLTFGDDEFDIVLSFDVFEHIPDYKAAFKESFRVLKPGGKILFSVPFDRNSKKNIQRAKITEVGEIEHILPAEYHGDPMNEDGGCLCFYHFGWEVIDDLKDAGFEDAYSLFCYSKDYGYLGGDQILFVAEKKGVSGKASLKEEEYQKKLKDEVAIYKNEANVHELPAVHHTFSHEFIMPNLKELTGHNNTDSWWIDEIDKLIEKTGRKIKIISLGCGNGDMEVNLLKKVKKQDMFEFTGLDINPAMLERAREYALQNGLKSVSFLEQDYNKLNLTEKYDVFIANHSLHHMVELEHIFGEISKASSDDMIFLINDMVGRNGHMMWDNTKVVVDAIWNVIPDKYKVNAYSKSVNDQILNFDFSRQGFEGIRAEDILPLLVQYFDFETYFPFGTIANRFIDRTYGHNFDMQDKDDAELISRIFDLDIKLLSKNKLAPCQAFIKCVKKDTATETVYLYQDPESSITARMNPIFHGDFKEGVNKISEFSKPAMTEKQSVIVNENQKHMAVISINDRCCLGGRVLSTMAKEIGHKISLIFFGEYNTHNHHITNSISPDGVKNYHQDEKILIELLEELNPDVIGFTFRSISELIVKDLAVVLKKAFPGKPILMGGIGATANPNEIIKYADMLCEGEGDYFIPEFFKVLEKNSPNNTEAFSSVPNLWVNKEGEIIKNERIDLVTDLDTVPFIDYDPKDKYSIVQGTLTRNDGRYDNDVGAYPLLTSRGCPYSCTYCHNSQIKRLYKGQRYCRRRSVDHVMEELVAEKERNPNIKMISVYDDSFPDKKGWLRDFAPKYREKINLIYWCFVHPEFVTEENLQLLVDSNCKTLAMGCQSFSSNTLKLYKRLTPLAKVQDAFRIIRKHDVQLQVDLITFNPLETEADKRATFEFLINLERNTEYNVPKSAVWYLSISRLTLFPNTVLFDMIDSRERSTGEFAPIIEDPQWEEFWEVMYRLAMHDYLPKDELIYMSNHFNEFKKQFNEMSDKNGIEFIIKRLITTNKLQLLNDINNELIMRLIKLQGNDNVVKAIRVIEELTKKYIQIYPKKKILSIYDKISSISESLSEDEDYDMAMYLLQFLHKENHNIPNTMNAIIKVHIRKGNYNQALVLSEKVLEKDPKNLEALKNLKYLNTLEMKSN